MDQRIERSKVALQAAVFQLLRRQRYEDITDDDIACHAGVARATFYVHFEDKAGLLRASLAAPFDLLSQLVGEQVPEKVIAAALEHLLHMRETVITVFGSSARAIITRTFASHLESRLAVRGLHRPGQLVLPFSMLSDRLADAILASIVEWLQSEASMPADGLARLLMRQTAGIIDASRAG